MNNRIKKIFINKSNKLASFVTGGYPNLEISLEIIHELVRSGSDIIEIGIPFSDPMADGPIIQQSNLRAIKKGINLESIFLICKNFRASNNFTPIILMGYYNPIHHYGNEKFNSYLVVEDDLANEDDYWISPNGLISLRSDSFPFPAVILSKIL